MILWCGRVTAVARSGCGFGGARSASATWTKPWSVMIPLRYSPDPLFEYACREGNSGLEGILAGARAEEQAAERR